MTCCSADGTNRCFSRRAHRYGKRLRKKGLDKAQSLLANGLVELGVSSKTILEIGCGAGGLHLWLLQRGAASAFGVEIAEGMLNQARDNAARLGLSNRTRYHLGDFVGMNGTVPSADVVILDKVVCCYSDLTGLIKHSTEKSTGLYAISYPGNSVLAKLAFKPVAWLGEFLKWSFHPYYHEPALVESYIVKQGFVEVLERQTPVWQIRIYSKTKNR